MSGRLIYLMGPSGSGKDSLLDALRAHWSACRPPSGLDEADADAAVTLQRPAQAMQIARRVVTRSAEAVGEDAIAVALDDFQRQEQAGAFALSWRANGLAYGIPRQIDDWLAAGQDVLVNGSRAYLGEARHRYPGLLALLLTVDNAVLRARLLARGRETPEQIEQRLARNNQFQSPHAACVAPASSSPGRVAEEQAETIPAVLALDNSGSLALSVTHLLALIEASRPCA
ncbi:MAG: phosphonate metabolism protein/1,5-bisphosphokinase (PRPP-forming) PhnN [Pseudomonas sp.]